MPYIWGVACDGVDTVDATDKSAVPTLHNAATGQLAEQSGLGLQSSAAPSTNCATGICMPISTDVLMNPSANMATKEPRRKTCRTNWIIICLL